MWVLPNVTSGLLSVKNWKNTEYVGNFGIGTTFHPTYKLNVNGTINATNVLINGTQIGGLTQGMTVQTTHLTYTQMDIKNNTGNPKLFVKLA